MDVPGRAGAGGGSWAPESSVETDSAGGGGGSDRRGVGGRRARCGASRGGRGGLGRRLGGRLLLHLPGLLGGGARLLLEPADLRGGQLLLLPERSDVGGALGPRLLEVGGGRRHAVARDRLPHLDGELRPTCVELPLRRA